MKTYNNNFYYNEFFRFGQQSYNFNLMDFPLPENDVVYTIKKVMEGLDFSKLLSKYKQRGRKAYNPIMMFALICYANARGIRSIDKIVEACERDLGFIWLTQGQKPKRDVFYKFKNDYATNDILDDLHYQFMKRLKEEGLITLEVLYVDGTKIEANANRYTFVWRGRLNNSLVSLLDNIQELYERYNKLIIDARYDVKYGILKEEMFVIEGIEKVKRVVLENKKRKRLNKKKLPHDIHLKIDNIGLDSIMRVKAILRKISEKEGIEFVYGKGKKQTELQRIYELFTEYGLKLREYKDNFEIMGEDRNSYSKTDKDATFMRMKDDHMMNGQLKPAYNYQLGVENYIITSIYLSNDRTDYNTLIPLISKHELMTDVDLLKVIADSGYCSEKNLKFCIENNIRPFIKLQEHEKMKTKKYYQDIGKHYNMKEIKRIDEQGNPYYEYKCANDRILKFTHKTTSNKQGFEQKFEHYECLSCEGCPLKKECFYNYNEAKYQGRNKILKINRNWEELKRISHANIQSEEGILDRQIRSIQAEGAFANMKHNHDFSRFNNKGYEKVYQETLFYVFGENLNKYHRFLSGELEEYKGEIIQ